jgi:hypothetical protein
VVKRRKRRHSRGWQRMAEGEGKYTFYPNPGSSSLASPSSLRAASPSPIEGSLALSILFLSLLFTLVHPPSMQTFLLVLSFAIFLSILRCCNFPVGDLYDVKICVVYLYCYRTAFHRGYADLSKYLPSDNAPDYCR